MTYIILHGMLLACINIVDKFLKQTYDTTVEILEIWFQMCILYYEN